jgi:uncharacterized protein (TIGR01732 family)
MSSENCGNTGNAGFGNGFALLVVLFILLIIVGAVYMGSGNEGNYGHGCGC